MKFISVTELQFEGVLVFCSMYVVYDVVYEEKMKVVPQM